MPSTPTLTLGRPIIFAAFLAVLFVLYVMSSKGSIPVPASPPRNYHYEYTVQKGYFMQSEEETDDKNFNFVGIFDMRLTSPVLTSNSKNKTSA